MAVTLVKLIVSLPMLSVAVPSLTEILFTLPVICLPASLKPLTVAPISSPPSCRFCPSCMLPSVEPRLWFEAIWLTAA